jgi:hypothetical protein
VLRRVFVFDRVGLRFAGSAAAVAAVASGALVAVASVLVSAATGTVSVETGAGVLSVVTGCVVEAGTSCARAEVEQSAKAAAIAGRALVDVKFLVFFIMERQLGSRRNGRVIIDNQSQSDGETSRDSRHAAMQTARQFKLELAANPGSFQRLLIGYGSAASWRLVSLGFT